MSQWYSSRAKCWTFTFKSKVLGHILNLCKQLMDLQLRITEAHFCHFYHKTHRLKKYSHNYDTLFS